MWYLAQMAPGQSLMLVELLVLMEEQRKPEADLSTPFENVLVQCHSSCMEPIAIPLPAPRNHCLGSGNSVTTSAFVPGSLQWLWAAANLGHDAVKTCTLLNKGTQLHKS